MLLDGNEIDADGTLYLQTNSNNDIHFGSGDFVIDGNKPIHVKEYHFTCGSCSHNTGVSSADWTAVIAGVDIHGDINETDRHSPLLKWMMEAYDGTWHIAVEMAHDHDDSEWWIDVMFIRKEMTHDYR